VSLVAFLVIGGLMTPLGGNYFRQIRTAIGQRASNAKPDEPDPVPASDAELAALLASPRPTQLLAIGAIGFFVILWLMMFKPF
jgi:hypothetical protein